MKTPAPSPEVTAILAELKAMGSEENRAGMARFGINTDHAFGVSMTALKPVARRLKRNHGRALALWATGHHEAQLLAVLTDEPEKVTEAQMNAWAAAFDSWDVCDQATSRLFAKTPHAQDAIRRWADDDREFVRRAAFALLAAYVVHAKTTADAHLTTFLPLIERHATDKRNLVKKAVNWALRQIGKRSPALYAPALATAERLAASSDATARWIGKDAVKELTDPMQRARIATRGK